MKDEKLQNGINEIHKIVMTNDEKKSVFDNVLRISSEVKYIKPIPSILTVFSFSSYFHNSKLIYYIVIPMIFVLSSGGLIFASERSLPGSALFPIKVKLLEPLGGVLKFGEKAKAEYESSLAVKRIVEAETLYGLGKLDAPKEKELNDLLEEHTDSLDKTLENLGEKDEEEEDKISSNFHSEMNNHAQILDVMSKKENKEDQEEEVKSKISETARSSGEKIEKTHRKDKENFKQEEDVDREVKEEKEND